MLDEAHLSFVPTLGGLNQNDLINNVNANGYGYITLKPGGWAYVLVAWISQRLLGQTCLQYYGLRMELPDRDPITQRETPVDVELQNLPMSVCGGPYVSAYRVGPYEGTTDIAKEMVNPNLLDSEVWSRIPDQIPWSDVQESSPQYSAHTMFPWVMLGTDSVVRLQSPVNADNGCAYRVMREREEQDGQTTFWFQDCPSPGARNYATGEYPPGTLHSEVLPRLEGMGAQHPGLVDYDFVENFGTAAAPKWVRAHAGQAVHDPKLPPQAAIIDPLPGCSVAQLRFSVPPPAIDTDDRFVRAYEATNTSNKPCSLAGVPKLDIAKTDRTCPNCENALFAIRPNGRIDLQPGQSAHFLTGAEYFDRRVCRTVAQMHITLSNLVHDSSDAAESTAPLEYGGCVYPDEVSAWRVGKFDGDPMNARWEKTHPGPLEPETAIPADCDRKELLTRGHPVMVPMTKTLAFGMSLEKQTFVAGEPIPLHIWIDNTGNETAGVMTCMGLDNFKGYGFDVYDAYGHRLLSRSNVKALNRFADPLDDSCRTDRGRFILSDRLFVCTRNFPIPIAAHTCVTGDDYDFETDLTGRYELPPGEYTIRPRDNPDAGDLCSKAARDLWHGTPGRDISFAVMQP